jgi:hypothetical protein
VISPEALARAGKGLEAAGGKSFGRAVWLESASTWVSPSVALWDFWDYRSTVVESELALLDEQLEVVR